MNKKEMLDIMDDVEILFLNNLDDTNIFKNPKDPEIVSMRKKLDEINEKIQLSGENGILEKRFKKQYEAFKVATLTRSEQPESILEYSEYITDLRRVISNGINTPQQAISSIVYALKTNNMPNKKTLDYVRNNIESFPSYEKNIYDALTPHIEEIFRAEEEAKKDKEKQENNQLIVPKTQSKITAILNKIKKFFSKEEKETGKNSQESKQNTMNAYNNTNNIRKELQVEVNQSKQNPQQPRQQKPKQQQPKPEHIVVSDLHGNIGRWNQLQLALKKNPNLKVTILGDAMDRGAYGPEILMQIKELSDKGRVDYLPGNHDLFAYNLLKMRQYPDTSQYKGALANLRGNHGDITLNKFANFDRLVIQEINNGNIKKPISLDELVDWLGEQPLQKVVRENGHNYALAHAIFDTKLYNYDSNFNLRKGLQLDIDDEKGKNDSNKHDILRRFNNILWYREKNPRTHMSDLSVPEGYCMVVGHTPQKNGINIEVDYQGNPKNALVFVDNPTEYFSLTDMSSEKLEDYIRKDIGREDGR